ncbi:hypothetical protein N0V82_003381 [Gnomoniopsis sp. IMI 355080]|nr:hypothetical protein N0V82_003381 [Gnomoniopsis sp. IMI 355080]
MACGSLNVIALVSGGKDSFFSALHCLENGHRLVALANLHPPEPVRVDDSIADGGHEGALASGASRTTSSALGIGDGASEGGGSDADLNSFMYQTVGHQVIPLYAEATGISLYRRPIVGGAVHTERDYAAACGEAGEAEDETESMIPLLKSVIKNHPEANALSAGAILSTYQRTRVESIAQRLGLTPLAYLWKYPILPAPLSAAKDEAQLLLDMAAAGLDPRIIKVASGGLDESFLWENVASAKGVMRLKKAMGKFGSAGLDTGAVLGEGGEFETLVVDGPAKLFKKRVVVNEEDRLIIREGGGQAWLKVTRAKVVEKTTREAQELNVRRPDALDERFAAVLSELKPGNENVDASLLSPLTKADPSFTLDTDARLQTWAVVSSAASRSHTIQEETTYLVKEIQSRLTQQALSSTCIISTVIILRSMADFPAINAIYGSLFTTPNPPSRVTISCGDLLPANSGNIAIYVTLCNGDVDRQGLHVQSRSYWAPANIGPYSQAVSFPVTAGGGARVVHIAGQIPLVPASMELPTEGMEMQLVLSLQHLWRIGVEVGVQWWTGAAVYFPRTAASKSSLLAREKALLAWTAWRDVHVWTSPVDDDEEGENGPDLWDRKFNPLYMSYGENGNKASLPDYSFFEDTDETKPVPFFFAVEVEELPRSAEAEWHAHAGLIGINSDIDTVRVYQERSERTTVEHCVLTSKAGGFLHSVVAIEVPHDEPADGTRSLEDRVQEANDLVRESLSKLTGDRGGPATPYLLYVNTGICPVDQISEAMGRGLSIIPCASIYHFPQGVGLGLVALYRMDVFSGR